MPTHVDSQKKPRRAPNRRRTAPTQDGAAKSRANLPKAQTSELAVTEAAGELPVLPLAVAGLVGVGAIGTGLVLLGRRRAQERWLVDHVLTLLGSAVVGRVAVGLGGRLLRAAASAAWSAARGSR